MFRRVLMYIYSLMTALIMRAILISANILRCLIHIVKPSEGLWILRKTKNFLKISFTFWSSLRYCKVLKWKLSKVLLLRQRQLSLTWEVVLQKIRSKTSHNNCSNRYQYCRTQLQLRTIIKFWIKILVHTICRWNSSYSQTNSQVPYCRHSKE